MNQPLTVVAVLAPPFALLSALASRLSALALDGAVPAGVTMPVNAAWFGRQRDGVTTHPELVELSGRVRPAGPSSDDGTTDDPWPAPRVLSADGTIERMRPRPPQARQVVRDRLRRVAEDARGAQAHTLLLVAPRTAWDADPAELRRELSAVADTVRIVIAVRRPEEALASAVAAAALTDAEAGRPLRARTARAALAESAWVDDLAFDALLARWRDPDDRAALLVVPATAEPAELFARLGLTGGAAGGQAVAALDPAPCTVVPPPTAAALDALNDASRAARRAVLPSARRDRAAARAAALDAAQRSGLAAPPFAFTDAERRAVAKRFTRATEAVRGAVAAHPALDVRSEPSQP